MTSKNLSNYELYEKLEAPVNTKTNEIKTEIKIINDTLATLDTNCRILESKVINLERKQKKNNILIFGLEERSEDDLPDYVIQILNEKLQIDLKVNDLNNIYKIGKKNTVVIEFTSYLKKLLIFKNVKKLKGTKISITHDLSPEDRKNNKILYENLKEARQKNLKSYIKNNKLHVNNEIFTVDQLKNAPDITHESTTSIPDQEEYEEISETKSSSAPPTPTVPKENFQELNTSTKQPILKSGVSKLSKERKNSTSSESTRSLRAKK